MNNLYWCGFILSLGTLPLGATNATDFMSEPGQTLWLLSTSKTACSMSQEIDNWGEVEFFMRSAREPKLEVLLKPNLKFSAKTPVFARTTAPKWRPGKADQNLGSITGYKLFDGYITGHKAWALVQGLQKGQAVSFTYRDELHYGNEYVRAVVSPLGFDPVYKDFMLCSSDLLPFSFEDIRYAVIHFVGKSNNLSDYSYERLRRIADFLSADPNFAEVVISAHTDSYGEAEENKKITTDQANVVKKFFVEKGVPSNKIIVRAFGEEHQAVSNEFEHQLPVNRRVVIEVNSEARYSEK